MKLDLKEVSLENFLVRFYPYSELIEVVSVFILFVPN